MNIVSVYVDDYKYVDYKISLPTHYNKHDIIVNSYKYDITAHAFNFLIHKIRTNEIHFRVKLDNNEILTEKDIMTLLLKLDHNSRKKIYTKLSGLIVREKKEYYTELLRSSIRTIEDLLELNRKLGLEFKILKVFVDEFIVDTPLLIKNIPNVFVYNFKESHFKIFMKSLPFLKKQLYLLDSNKFEINLNFYNKSSNLLTDIENILEQTDIYSNINNITNKLIQGEYDVRKLVMVDDNNQPYIISDNVKITVDLDYINSYKYYKDYYFNMYKDIVSSIIYSNIY